jgi:hypothetical protein
MKATDQKAAVSFHIPAKIERRADGILVSPGRPVAKITPSQFGNEFGVSPDTVYRYIQNGTIPERFVEFAGPRKILIAAQAIQHCRDLFRAARGFSGN